MYVYIWKELPEIFWVRLKIISQLLYYQMMSSHVVKLILFQLSG